MNDIDKDDEFLLWIAKRLVFKYQESEEILTQVQRIIAKNRVIRSICYEHHNHTQLAITKVANYLLNWQKINDSSFQSLQHKINLNPQSISLDDTKKSSLETMDMDSFLRGV